MCGMLFHPTVLRPGFSVVVNIEFYLRNCFLFYHQGYQISSDTPDFYQSDKNYTLYIYFCQVFYFTVEIQWFYCLVNKEAMKAVEMIITNSNKNKANPPHKGAVIHNQDHLTMPKSFKVKRIRNIKPKILIPPLLA
jgi:hypothetical protein